MYTICRTTHQATGVEHSVYCNFFNSDEKSLVVAGANVVRVFRLVPEFENKAAGATKREEDETPPKVKLECMATYNLHDTIITMAVVSLNPSRDSLMLGFKDAKLSIVEYDPQVHYLKTVSLHYFEKDDIHDGFYFNVHLPIIRVDPETRCACMVIYGRKLVIIPFRKDLVKENVDYSAPLARGPIMQSYIIDPRDSEALRIDNIKDIQFLHGYYDPTLAILYEPIKTFPGRVSVRQDTYCFAALSLNLRQRLSPVIWSLQNLPFDCFKLLAVPKPIGGALLFAANSLVYLTQSIPPYGISLNSMGDKNTNFPLRKQEGVVLAMDNANAELMTEDRVVISLKSGELYVLTLVADSMRAVRSFHLDKAASSVLTCCMALCEGQYLFLGSRLGNSLLLRFTEKTLNNPVRSKSGFPAEHEPPSKRKKLGIVGDWVASNVDDIEDPDILRVYGREETTVASTIASYTFEVMDSLLNIGPCGHVAMGEPAFLSEEYESHEDPCMELVCTSGHGKNGALSILQRSVKPQVLTTFGLPGILDMWTLVVRKDEKRKREANDHSFLILSKEDSSLILKTEEEISEVDESGFNTSSKTIFAGNIGNNKYIVQVNAGGVRLLDGATQLQHVVVDVGSPIVAASLADPYLVVLTECGTVMVFTLITSRYAAPKFSTTKIPNTKKSRLQTISAYCDFSGIFTFDFPEDISGKRKAIKSDAEIKKELDDEDEMLYAKSHTSVFDPPKSLEPENSQKKANKWWRKWYKEARPTYWVVGTNNNGDLEIYSLPDFVISYTVRNFWLGERVLHDHTYAGVNEHTRYAPENIPVIHEVLIIGMGHKKLRPVLFARVDQDLLMYEVFSFFEYTDTTQMKMRFRQIEHHLVLRERKTDPVPAAAAAAQPKKIDRVTKFRPFNNISVYNGVFIAGPYPHWVILTIRGEYRFHPMSIDGPVKCFAPFRNVNCHNGFMYFNKKDSLRICILPTILSYDAPWPVRKVPLRCTPHFIVHHLETKTYCVITSNSEPTTKIWKFNGDDKEEVFEERDERFIKVQAPVFTAQLFSPVNWQMIPNTDYNLDRWEHVTCCENVLLAYEGDRSGVRGYIVLGTTCSYGEDITCRGRIIIFDVIDVVPEPGQPLTKNRLKTLYDAEQKGPVTAITYCSGYLVSAIGQKIYIWQLKDRDLVGVAFIDIPVYIHRLITVKNIIYGADVCKSVFVLRFQKEYRTLSMVSKDYKPMHVYSIEYLIDNANMAFLASDAEKNIVVFSYSPETRESIGGVRLIRKGDMNVGSHINAFFRIRCRQNDVSGEILSESSLSKKHITMFASLDGSLGHVLLISERTYRRFSMIYNLLVQSLAHTAGLNPKTCKAFECRKRLNLNPSKGIIDWQLIMSFLHLSVIEKSEIAKKIGAKVNDIVEDIMYLDRIAAHF